MEEVTLRYGAGQIRIKQSDTLIGVRPQQNREKDASLALNTALEGAKWHEAGMLGGFRIVSIAADQSGTDKLLDEIRRANAIAVGTHVFELPDGKGIFVPTGDIFVEFDPGVDGATRQKAFDKLFLEIKETRGADGYIARVTPRSPNPVKVAVALQEMAGVRIAEPDLASHAALKGLVIPTDSLLADQWHLRNTGNHRNSTVGFTKGADARVIEAWSAAGTLGQPDVIVAVIDDGFDLTHPDFATPGKVVHAWDFTRGTANPAPNTGDWHGTACAGVAVASAGGGGVVGAAPGCTLMPVRWGSNLADAQIEAWFDYVARKGAWVVSCSWGAANPYFPLSTRASRAITRCAKEGRGGKGCVVVFAAGNDDRNINDPGNNTLDGFAIHPDVIAVAASTSRDQKSDYSNYGNEISICAPSSGAGGWSILTSDVTGVDPRTGAVLGYDAGDYTYDFGGTSSACPLVAGIAALVLSVAPNLTSAEVKDLLQDTARKIGGAKAKGHSPQFGHGCVNALDAVQSVMERAQPLLAARAQAKG